MRYALVDSAVHSQFGDLCGLQQNKVCILSHQGILQNGALTHLISQT